MIWWSPTHVLKVMLSLVLLAPIQSISGGRGLSGRSSCKDNLNKPADWLTNPCSLPTNGHIVQVDTPVIPWTEVKNRIIHTQNWMTEQIASRNEKVFEDPQYTSHRQKKKAEKAMKKLKRKLGFKNIKKEKKRESDAIKGLKDRTLLVQAYLDLSYCKMKVNVVSGVHTMLNNLSAMLNIIRCPLITGGEAVIPTREYCELEKYQKMALQAKKTNENNLDGEKAIWGIAEELLENALNIAKAQEKVKKKKEMKLRENRTRHTHERRVGGRKTNTRRAQSGTTH